MPEQLAAVDHVFVLAIDSRLSLDKAIWLKLYELNIVNTPRYTFSLKFPKITKHPKAAPNGGVVPT